VPLAAEGHVRRVSVDGGEVLKGIRFIFTPGHSIDHAAISITSQGTEAIFGGDVMHHPLSYTTRISSLCSVNFPKLPGVHGAGLRATPRKGTRYTSAVISRSLLSAGSPKRVKTSRGSLTIRPANRISRAALLCGSIKNEARVGIGTANSDIVSIKKLLRFFV
jgi:hypothetical protein